MFCGPAVEVAQRVQSTAQTMPPAFSMTSGAAVDSTPATSGTSAALLAGIACASAHHPHSLLPVHPFWSYGTQSCFRLVVVA